MGYIIQNSIPSTSPTLPDIQFEGEHRAWILTFQVQDILDYVNVHSVVDNKKAAEQSPDNILKAEDNDLILASLSEGVSNVYMVLARRMPNLPLIDATKISFKLEVGENHDDNMSNILYMRILSYLQNYAYYKWIGADTDILSGKLDEIRSAIHYRKHGITRKITNLI